MGGPDNGGDIECLGTGLQQRDPDVEKLAFCADSSDRSARE